MDKMDDVEMENLSQEPIHTQDGDKENIGEYIMLVLRANTRLYIHTDKGNTYQGDVERGTDLRLTKNEFLSSLGRLKQIEYIGGLSLYCLVEDTGKLFEYDLVNEPGKPPTEMKLMIDFQPPPTRSDPIPEERKIHLPIESIGIVNNDAQATMMVAIARDGSVWSWQPIGPNDPEGNRFYKYDYFPTESPKIKSIHTGAWSQYLDESGSVWVWGINAYRYFSHVYSRDIFDTFEAYQNEQDENYKKESPQFWDDYSETFEERRLKIQNDFDKLLQEIRSITDSVPFVLDATVIPGGHLSSVALRDEISAGINKTTGEINIITIPENNSRVYLNTTDITREELPIEFTKLLPGPVSNLKQQNPDTMDTTETGTKEDDLRTDTDEFDTKFVELYIGTRLLFALDIHGKIHVWKLPGNRQRPLAIAVPTIRRNISAVKLVSKTKLQMPDERDYYKIDDAQFPPFAKFHYSYNGMYSELFAVSSDFTRLYVLRESWFEPYPVELNMSFVQLPSGTV